MEETNPPTNVSDKNVGSDNPALAGTAITGLSGGDITPASLDVTLKRFKSQVMNLCDCIMKGSIAYVDARLCIQTACRIKALYDNNRPHPNWWNEPRAQELLHTISNLESMEETLTGIKDFIKKQKDVLMRLYDQMRQAYMQENDLVAGGGTVPGSIVGMCSEHKEKIAELMKDINIKMVHVMTAMELVLAADNRSDVAIDATVRHQLGMTENSEP